MSDSVLKPRAINLNKCRAITDTKSCSVDCSGHDEIVLIPLETLNRILKDKKIDALVVGNFMSEHLTELKDAWQIKKLFGDFGFTGKAYEKMIRGKKYVIFKGKPGLRKVFTGTKYGAENSKVLSYGVGKAGLVRSIKGGTVVSLVFVNAWNIAEFFINDDKTLADLGVTMVSDSVKVAVASFVGGAAGFGLAALGAPVVVPLAGGLVVGIVVGTLLDKADEQWKITESFRLWVHDVIKDSQPMLNSAKSFMDNSIRNTKNTFGNMSREFDREFKEWKLWFEKFSFR